MKGADVVVASLEREGIDTVFAYPGGASMELHQALVRSQKIRTILPRHEQGGGFMAHGYARATGKASVCMATSGPGATNLITCIADAYMDSIPLVAITGQVYQSLIGKSAFQETDVLGISLPVVKHSYMVLDKEELPSIIKEAFHIAQTGRPGPVLIDIPKDVQQAVYKPRFPLELNLPGYPEPPKATDEELLQVLGLIQQAERPMLYTGGGIISSHATQALREFVKKTGVPTTSTLMGLGAMDPFPCIGSGCTEPSPEIGRSAKATCSSAPVPVSTTGSPARWRRSHRTRRSFTSTSTAPSTTKTSPPTTRSTGKCATRSSG